MTPLSVPRRTYRLAPGADASQVLTAVKDLLAADGGRPQLDLAVGPARRSTGTVLDTADRRLRAAGLDLELVPARGGPARFVLRDEGTTRSALAPEGDPRRRYLAEELPRGGLWERLAPVIEVRALLPVVELERDELPADVRNRDDKLVVRLTVLYLWALPRHDAPVPLGGRVELTGVLGYPRPLARVQDLLEGQLGLVPVPEPVADEAVAALGGDPAGLSGRVKVDLQPDEPVGVAAVRVLRRLADMVDANLPGTIDDLDTEFLHDLRVAIRRSRSVLREMKKVFDPESHRRHAADLRWIQAVTGPTRDLDVQLLEWDTLAAHLPEPRRAQLGLAHAVLVARRREAFRTMKATLRSPEFRQRWWAWRDFLEADAGPGPAPDDRPDAARPVREVAARRVRSVYRRMVADGRAIAGASPPESLHDLRKRGKELRYLLELFGALLPAKKVRPMITTLKGLQDVLGRHHDREVQSDNLRALSPELATRPGGAEALLALGALVDRLELEKQEARAQFTGRFAAFVGLKVPR